MRRMFRQTLTTFALSVSALCLLATPSVARGGEDWPFFCPIQTEDNMVDHVHLVHDSDGPSGYGLELYSNGNEVAYIYPDVTESDDRTYLQVYGSMDVGDLKMHELQLLAYIAKTNKVQSLGDARVTWRGQQGEFSMKPMNCRAAVQVPRQ